MSMRQPFYQRDGFLYFVVIAASALLSCWISVRESVINPDAICYLLSAEKIGEGGLKGAMQLCGQAKWPFYSALIYAFAQASHFSYLMSANLLDGFFTIISVTAFIAIFKEIGANQRICWLAAFTILLSHEFNSVRQYIVRDHGFWAFYLASVLYMLRYFRTVSLLNAAGWSISLLLATLFRIEGAIFLLMLPFTTWFLRADSWCERIKQFLSMYALTLIIALAGAVYLLLHPQRTLSEWGRLHEVVLQLQHGAVMIMERYQATKAALAQHVLTPSAMRDAGLVLLVTLTVWYLINVIGNLSWIYSGLVVYAWASKAMQIAKQAKLVLMSYVFVNLVVTFCFFAQNLFLAKRYLIAFTLILMMWVPFALNRLLQWPAGWRKRAVLSLVSLAILASALGGIVDFGRSKKHIRAAGDWLAVHVPPQARLYCNDIQTMYYSRHFGYQVFERAIAYGEMDTIAHGKWKQYDYAALRVNAKEENASAVLNELPMRPLVVFENERGDRVLIYKIRNEEKKP